MVRLWYAINIDYDSFSFLSIPAISASKEVCFFLKMIDGSEVSFSTKRAADEKISDICKIVSVKIPIEFEIREISKKDKSLLVEKQLSSASPNSSSRYLTFMD